MRVALKYRIILTFTALGMLLSLILGLVTYHALEYSEKILVGENINTQANVISDLYAKFGEEIPLKTDVYQLYIKIGNDTSRLPEQLKDIPLSTDEIYINGKELELIIKEREETTLYFLYDLSSYESFEVNMSYFLFLTIIFSTALSLWLGRLITGKVIKPVKILSHTIANSSTQTGSLKYEYMFANDEIGFLANKFLEYDAELRVRIAREKQFTTNVSHELRTPLSVILGTTEVLLEKFPSNKLIERIKYESLLLKNISELMLFIARGKASDIAKDKKINVNTMVEQILDALKYEFTTHSIEVVLTTNSQLIIESSKTAFYMAVRNILHNAYSYTSYGKVDIQLSEKSLVISNTGSGLPVQASSCDKDWEDQSLNCGVGLKITKDLCDLCDIDFSFEVDGSKTPNRTIVSFNFEKILINNI
jgi:signal transduction histidine kinase